MHGCLACDAVFEQTPDGGKALRQHEFTHGFAELFAWNEIAGQSLRMVVVPYEADLYGGGTDLYAIDDERGIVYHLAHEYKQTYRECGGWKWKIGKATTPEDGPKVMPLALVSQLSGSRNTDEK